jgi:uncharacterized membrane protein YgdD (TMEM256/DUF423 family)
MQGAGMAAIAATIAAVILVVGITIVSSTLTTANFTGLTKTVTDNIPIFMAIGGLIVAIGWAIM